MRPPRRVSWTDIGLADMLPIWTELLNMKVRTVSQHQTPRRSNALVRRAESRRRARAGGERIDAVMARAAEIGLLGAKSGRISGRVSPRLIATAKAQTGLASDTALIEYALSNIAIEDNFFEAFDAVKGTVDPDLDLEF